MKKTTDNMHSMGLDEKNITTIVEQMLKAAQNMTHVELDYTVDNSTNDYSVSGSAQIYTIAGNISCGKGTAQYRLLANKGSAGQLGGHELAPMTGNIIPMS